MYVEGKKEGRGKRWEKKGGEGREGEERGERGEGEEGRGGGEGEEGRGGGEGEEGRGGGEGEEGRGKGPTFTPGVSSSNSFSTPSSNMSSSSGATLTAARDPSAVQGKGGGVGIVTALYPTNLCSYEVSQSVQLDNISTRHHIGHSHTIHKRLSNANQKVLVIPLVEVGPVPLIYHQPFSGVPPQTTSTLDSGTCDHNSITCCITHRKDYAITPTHYYDYTALCLQFC